MILVCTWYHRHWREGTQNMSMYSKLLTKYKTLFIHGTSQTHSCSVLILEWRHGWKCASHEERQNNMHGWADDVRKQIKETGSLEIDRSMKKKMRKKFKIEYPRRLILILKLKLNGWNKIESINGWSPSLLRYGAEVIPGQSTN